MNDEPKKGDVRFDNHGKIVAMAFSQGWILARRPGCTPFVKTLREWNELLIVPPLPPTAEPAKITT